MSNLSLPCFGTLYELDQVADGVRLGLQEFQSALSIVQSGLQFGAIGIARRTHFLVEGLNILNCLLAYLVVPILQLDKMRKVRVRRIGWRSGRGHVVLSSNLCQGRFGLSKLE